MEKSIILMFIKFFNECAISKTLKRAKIVTKILALTLIMVSCTLFNVGLEFANELSNITTVCISIIYGLTIALILYLQDNLIALLFPNEYLLMKSIKEYLGKIFKDFYLSDVNEDKMTNHILTLSYYIGNLYDLEHIKSNNSILLSNKRSKLACNELLYLINNKLLRGGNCYTISDLYSKRIADVIFGLFTIESENVNKETEPELNMEINRFLNSKLGRKFIDDNVIYASGTFDDYNCDEWRLYNKRNLPVISHDHHYRRHIYDNNKKCYNGKYDRPVDSKKNKKEKSYLSWIDEI